MTLSGFDAAAERYDDDERDNPAFAHMRAWSRDALRDAFPPRARLIEVGSGSGTEAAWLATRGARLALCDVSPRLLERAAAKVRAAGAQALLGAHLLPARRVGELAAIHGPASFDGGYSSLGPLNCEPALAPVAAGLAALIRPGGALVLSVMNRICAMEIAWFAAHADVPAATRRWRGMIPAAAVPGGPRDVPTWYHARGQIERAFAGAFATESAEALPLVWPPTYLGSLVARFAPIYRALAPLDRRLARWPMLRDLGDHVLLRLRRR